jgi:hypothetical protein
MNSTAPIPRQGIGAAFSDGRNPERQHQRMKTSPRRKPLSKFPPARGMMTVYDGQTFLGSLRRCGEAHEACDAKGQSLGFFHGIRAAADASAAASPAPSPARRDGLAQLRALGRARREAL